MTRSRQTDLTEFGFISYSPLPRQSKLNEFTKQNLILDTLRESVKEKEICHNCGHQQRNHEDTMLERTFSFEWRNICYECLTCHLIHYEFEDIDEFVTNADTPNIMVHRRCSCRYKVNRK